MQSATAAYTAKNALLNLDPVYLMHFDGAATDYVTSNDITSPDNTLKEYIEKISGNTQSITPEEGKSSIGQTVISLLDVNDEITALIAGDSYNLQRKKTTVKCGYRGLSEADMLSITGWVTDIKEWSDHAGYDITITDPQKWLQRKVFRGAEDMPVSLTGNPLNLALAVLTSTGAGTNGNYDWYAAANGLAIDYTLIQISHIEELRDTWFAGVKFTFDIRARMTAKKFLQDQIFKPLNIYPIVRGDGTFDIIVYHPPLPITSDTQAFTKDNIIDFEWNQNMGGLINEVEFHYDYDAADKEYDSETYYIDSTSVANRGPGKKVLKIESQGITAAYGAVELSTRRSNRVFQRYADPPPKIKLRTLFSRHLSEPGDIVPVTHSDIPDLSTGARGITKHLMEIVNRQVDWRIGVCVLTLLYTSWTGKKYACISPSSVIASGDSTTVFHLASAAEAAKYEEDWVVDIFYKNMVAVASGTGKVISDITGDQITLSTALGLTPASGMIMTFSSYDSCVTDQQEYAFIADSGNKVGAADDDPYYIC